MQDYFAISLGLAAPDLLRETGKRLGIVTDQLYQFLLPAVDIYEDSSDNLVVVMDLPGFEYINVSVNANILEINANKAFEKSHLNNDLLPAAKKVHYKHRPSRIHQRMMLPIAIEDTVSEYKINDLQDGIMILKLVKAHQSPKAYVPLLQLQAIELLKEAAKRLGIVTDQLYQFLLPAVDIYEDSSDNLVVVMDLPGFKNNHVRLDVKDNILTIDAARSIWPYEDRGNDPKIGRLFCRYRQSRISHRLMLPYFIGNKAVRGITAKHLGGTIVIKIPLAFSGTEIAIC